MIEEHARKWICTLWRKRNASTRVDEQMALSRIVRDVKL